MTTPTPFGARLRRAMDTRGPLCVGIDPHAALLADWGLDDNVAGLERFTRTVVDALADRVAVLKPQSAFFERFGSRGVAVLESAVADARDAGALVLMDAKRGDIGSTMAAYAAAYLDPAGPLFSDAVTVSPYLGFGSLRPALEAAERAGSGVFVLALTSNPEGAEVQRATTAGGGTVAQAVLDRIAEENAGADPLGSVGAVVGATLGDTGANLAVNGPLLAPGIGAQGATAADLPKVFGDSARNVVPSISRGVLRAGPSAAALRDAAAAAAEELARALG
ncbi:orotidine-5'-phosphate decarboxylase [Streptomyces alkaliterrae]|uniref:Orotidine 5'-phosphate decarboxylase n=1 Tax=Streptomyces alkaliterrae TaxID=2213162 RepID=A0A5P0YLN8_9ACTN|nr:orotidine-5'-phosphate decarboxylase [Streptomyces alkaliterrae]MBB1254453.1 orotidine-5'-phosphate decarboxylase [Streptomyces alkaliterrae]MBB1258271.1 orotidine-5'-phosphate decarboxylase [Streptomyces alkaliterrae]MQS01284.1 orotidine-5'-phosphate decarboxylase [Streptomyces alkaliterrae]